jgi:hypothetical protein
MKRMDVYILMNRAREACEIADSLQHDRRVEASERMERQIEREEAVARSRFRKGQCLISTGTGVPLRG